MQQSNLIEAYGKKLRLSDDAREPSNYTKEEQKVLEELERIEMEEAFPPKSQEKIE